MEKFLQNVAAYLLEKYNNDLSEFSVVFPNRRAGLFFQKYLSRLVKKPVFSPHIYSISELVSSFSALQTDDQNSLVVALWKVFTRVTQHEESLDDFFYWGEMLISDFNDIDKYLVDAKQLFKNIESLKEIDAGFDFLSEEQIKFLSSFWKNILEVRNSADKNYFLSIWNKLYPIYTAFNDELIAGGKAYEGMIYRDMVINLKAKSSEWENRKIAFVGFNALNNCEKKLFSFFKNSCEALFFWDFDRYYMDAFHHEASFFMSANLKLFPMPFDFQVSDTNFSQLQHIDVIAVPGFSGQAVYASKWLADHGKTVTSEFDNTAVVLCDESLLIPVLNTLPDTIGDFNVTMGFPLKNSVVFALLKGIVDIDRNGRKNSDGILQFYYRNVLSLLHNPLLKPILGDSADRLNELVQKENKIYLTIHDFTENDLLQFVFNLPEDANEVKQYLHKIFEVIFHNLAEDDRLTRESLYQLYLLVNRLHLSLFNSKDENDRFITRKLFYQLLIRSAERMNIPFEGEPLSGMQIMGFLETRCLDFDNLLVLSFNDDKLPGNQHQHSFIPYSLKKGFDMPVIEHKNAMYSYYFYRLIQRAKNVTLVYDSRTEGMTRGEVSRYAVQLKYEASHLKVNEKQAVFNFDSSDNHKIVIEKTAGIKQALKDLVISKPISPTLLNTYLDCKLKFYFRYVEGIRESEEVMEEIDQMIFGRIAHLVMEGLYKPYVNTEVTSDVIKRLIADKNNLSRHLTGALRKEFFKSGNFDMNGKNILIYDIIEKYVIRILQYDLTIVPFTVLALEKEFLSTILVGENDNQAEVKIGGIIDRLDQTGNRIRVVDYKTGKADSSVKSVESLFVPSDKRNKAAFQTMIYARGVCADDRYELPVVPSVYGAREVFAPGFDPAFQLAGQTLIYQEAGGEFENYLSALLEEILLDDISFTQTEDERKCTHCPYNAICNR